MQIPIVIMTRHVFLLAQKRLRHVTTCGCCCMATVQNAGMSEYDIGNNNQSETKLLWWRRLVCKSKRNAWVIANSLATCRSMMMETWWLSPMNDVQYINRSEFDSIQKEINQADVLPLKTDCFSGYHWTSNALTHNVGLKIKPTIKKIIQDVSVWQIKKPSL